MHPEQCFVLVVQMGVAVGTSISQGSVASDVLGVPRPEPQSQAVITGPGPAPAPIHAHGGERRSRVYCWRLILIIQP